jgi:hypothetical protein
MPIRRPWLCALLVLVVVLTLPIPADDGTGRVTALVRQMTLDEKLSLLHGGTDPQGIGESFSEDPLVSARTVAADVRGIRLQGLIATVKHYAENNQETGGTASTSRSAGRPSTRSSCRASRLRSMSGPRHGTALWSR